MSRPIISVCMATYDDFQGVYFSVQALRMYQDMRDVEIIVLDNNPTSEDGKETANFIQSIQHHFPASYHIHSGPGGTTQTREELFTLAKGELVVVMDAHVFLKPGALEQLRYFWESATEEDKRNMYTGSLIYDNLDQVSTHFECTWSSEMLGVWATAWVDPKGVYLVGKNIENELHMKVLNSDGPYMRSGIPWAGHEKVLREKGFYIAGEDGTHFEVPAQGLGMFIMSKEHWVGFNPHFRSFGGEECTVHASVRARGDKVINLPFMSWLHRFGRPGGPKYPISREGKARNYVLAYNQLGWDLEPARAHFVDTMGMKQAMWDLIVEDPINFDPKNNKLYKQVPNTDLTNTQPVFKSNLGMDLPMVSDNLHTMATIVAGMPRDLDQHAMALMNAASMCESVAEITIRRESTLFLLAGLTRKKSCGNGGCSKDKCDNSCKGNVIMDSWQSERDTLLGLIHEAVKTSPGKPVTFTDHDSKDPLPAFDRNYDMLFLDTNTGEILAEQLKYYVSKVDKFIAIHDTQIYGMKGADGKPGHIPTIKGFLKENPDWFISYHTDNQYGLTILSKDPAVKPPTLIAPWPKTTAEGMACGVGQQVKASLKLMGIVASEGCSCQAKARQMDAWGPDGCREHMDEILDGLKEEAVKRNLGHLYFRPAVKIMVLRAIRAAEKQLASGECS